jgi:hypothetical protein
MSSPTPQWSVTSVIPFTDFKPGIGPQQGFNVNFITVKGQSGSVFVPTAQIQDKMFVAALVQSTVDALHGILDLTPGR